MALGCDATRLGVALTCGNGPHSLFCGSRGFIDGRPSRVFAARPCSHEATLARQVSSPSATLPPPLRRAPAAVEEPHVAVGRLDDGTPVFAPVGRMTAVDGHRRVLCHACGEPLAHLAAAHLARHGFTTTGYRQRFGLRPGASLTAPGTASIKTIEGAFAIRRQHRRARRTGCRACPHRGRGGGRPQDAGRAAQVPRRPGRVPPGPLRRAAAGSRHHRARAEHLPPDDASAPRRGRCPTLPPGVAASVSSAAATARVLRTSTERPS
ncbi:MAG: hypothetical protein JWO67_973 [Streptosporangiaceae bacterium]|nr:hypothetical protein [Streptosporangiaceae bacterium]